MHRTLAVVLLAVALAAPAKAVSSADSKPDPQATSSADSKNDAKTETKADVKVNSKADAKAGLKPEAKAEATKGAKADTNAGSKKASQTEAKADTPSDSKRSSKADAKKADSKKAGVKKDDAEKTAAKSDSGSSAKSARSHKNAPPKDVLPDLSHERVDYWVAAFSKMDDYHKQIAAGFIRKAKYQDLLERRLREHGMPQNLIYLAMEESAFNPEARSHAKAVGIWQLTAGTARNYGLKVTNKIDERKQVEKETDAALRFLLHLHKRFGCWYLAAAAYNTGEHRVAKIMHKTLGRESGRDRDYYRIWPNLPGETRDYVPAIIALNRIGKDPKRYGF